MDFRYFDAHTHPHFTAFDGDREDVIGRARELGIGINLVGTQKDTSEHAVRLAEKHEHAYASVGLHPIHTGKSYHDKKELGDDGTPKGFTSRGEKFGISNYEALARSPKVIAIGECGLDYYRCDESTKGVQVEAFEGQIELANKIKKPLMLHIRNAYKDAYDIVKAHAKVLGNVHFFAGTWEEAKLFLDLCYTLSFTGVITFTHDYDEVVRNMPLDSILSETDAPYVSPVPHRGKRNEPANVVEVVKAIARIRNISEEVVQQSILENTKRLFAL